ncbi:putative phospholipid hydroperoxide glutathione peroxidase, partial [Mucuna pruriens]
MLCTSTTRIFFRTTTIRFASSSSSSVRFFFNPNPTHFCPFHTSFKPLPSAPTTPLSFSLRTDHTMASSNTKSVHDFTVKDARGNDINLGDYKGKVLLIVNVASQCGLTNSNYTELSKLYEKYKQKGLEILAFPCNQFGAQEPGTNDQIQDFVCTRFKAEFPIFDKVDVNGDKAAPLYKHLKSSKGGLFGDSIKWNFSKFLVDKEGNVVDRYAPTTSPLSIEDAKGDDVDLVTGMTNSNYVELNQLYDKYKDKVASLGLEILAFPCNQFGEEEPGNNDQIKDFVCTRFKSEFPIFDKIEVNGNNSAPLYKFLKSGKWGIFGDDIQWNFAKFLVDKDGQVVDRYYPTTSPLSLERDIRKLIGI